MPARILIKPSTSRTGPAGMLGEVYSHKMNAEEFCAVVRAEGGDGAGREVGSSLNQIVNHFSNRVKSA